MCFHATREYDHATCSSASHDCADERSTDDLVRCDGEPFLDDEKGSWGFTVMRTVRSCRKTGSSSSRINSAPRDDRRDAETLNAAGCHQSAGFTSIPPDIAISKASSDRERGSPWSVTIAVTLTAVGTTPPKLKPRGCLMTDV